MPFIDMGDEFSSTQEANIPPLGKEYDFVVDGVDENNDPGSKKHNIRLTIRIENADDENFTPIWAYMGIPNSEWEAEKDAEKNLAPGTTSRTKMLMIRRTLRFFGLPWEDVTGFDPLDFQGARARGGVAHGTYNGRQTCSLSIPPLPQGQ